MFRDKSGTEYTLNWLPIGGFVKMKGEDSGEDGAQDQDSLAGKSFWKQSVVILAGVFMNFVFAIVIFSILFFIGVEPLAVNTKFPTATETRLIPTFDQAISIGFIKTDGLLLSPLTGSIAETSGIKEGDILLRIDGVRVTKPEDMIEKIRTTKAPLSLEVRRGTETRSLQVTPKDGKIGSYVGYNVVDVDKGFRYKYGFLEAIKVGTVETYNQSKMTFELFGNLIGKIFTPKIPEERQEAVKSLGGPIAVGNLFVDLINAKAAASVICIIAALISVNLGVFNLLPLPALDGGRFAFLAINRVVALAIGKRKITGQIEHIIHIVGFAFLILVSIFVAYNDVLKIIFKH